MTRPAWGVVAAYAVCAAVWGTTWYAIRVCIGPGGYPPLTAAALRFTVAASIIGAVFAAGYWRPGPRGARGVAWMAAAGLANAGSYALIYLAEQFISGGLTATLFALFPLACALLAAASRTERVTRTAVAGSVVGLLGVALIYRDRLSVSSAQGGAVALVLLGVFLSALYSVVIKRVAGQQHPIAAVGVFTAVTAVALWSVALWVGEPRVPWPLPLGPTAAVLYLSVFGTVIVFGCYVYLLRHVSLMTVSTLVFIEPVIALCIDAAFEQQVGVDVGTYLGGAVIFAGVAINVFGPRLAGRRPLAS